MSLYEKNTSFILQKKSFIVKRKNVVLINQYAILILSLFNQPNYCQLHFVIVAANGRSYASVWDFVATSLSAVTALASER